MEPPFRHNGKKYLFGNQSPLLPAFLLQHKPPRAFGDAQWLPVPLASFPGERREERALVVSLCCSGARGWSCCCCNLETCFGWSAGRLSPSNSVTIRAEHLMSAHFKESFPLLILFFPGVLTGLWTTQYPLFTALRCQTPQSVYITGVYSFKIKSVGEWELEMLF